MKIASDGSMQATGNYPVTYQRSLKGFALSVKGLTERDAIPANYRDTGMLILVRDSSAIYTLVGGIANINWVKYLTGGGGGGSGGDSTCPVQFSAIEGFLEENVNAKASLDGKQDTIPYGNTPVTDEDIKVWDG